MTILKRFLKDECGATAIEYALIAAGISLAIIAGAILSYGQARFFRPLLQLVASKAALHRCESLLDAYGRYARVALFVHPNACAMYFTALGLLGRSLTRELAYLSVGAAAAVGILFVVVTRLVSSVGTTDDGELQVLLAAASMGPLALADLIGLDVCLAILEVLHRGLGDDKYRAAPLLRRMVAAGDLGRKTGKGFFEYGEKGEGRKAKGS